MSQEQPASIGQTAAAFVEKRWGGPSRTTPLTAFAISAGAAVRVALRNPRRMQYLILNPGTGNVYWGQTSTDAALAVVLISPLGGSLISLVDEDGEGTADEAYIFSAAATTVYVQEVVRK